ncbi:MAG: hypothetical protein R3B54_06310 [Bdellovibrionota bacterium]
MNEVSPVFTTVVTDKYAAGARVLFESLAEHHPGLRFFTLAVDDSVSKKLPSCMNPISPTVLSRSPHPDVHYDAFELCNALRYSWIEYLMKKESPSHVVYLDADILVLGSFAPLFDSMGDSAFCLTPHILRPFPSDGHRPNDASLIDFGFYNSGMLAFAANGKTPRILEFMKERAEQYCYNDPPRYFVDQKILPLATGLFSEAFLQLKHPGFNVAYWNLHERLLSYSGGRFRSNSETLVFFHFSGFDVESPDCLTRWPSRPLGENTEVVKQLLKGYCVRLARAFEETARLELG